MENILCSDSLEIQQPAVNYLTPTDYIGAGANGFVLKVSDKAHNISALKIVPIIVRSKEENASRIKRERQFYQHMKTAEKIPNLARVMSWWSIENMETSTYLKWNKELRKRLNAKALDYPSQQIKIASQLVNSGESGELMLCVHFVQMEYYTSGNLKTWLESNSNKCEETYTLRIELFCDILSAVDFLHERGLMHRDICPNNIFLAKDNDRLHAVLGDFDTIVSCEEQALWPLTKVRETFTSVMGTDPYTAPEIHSGHYDKPCDLFSLGVITLNLFFNIVDYKGLRQALYQIQVRNVFPTCIFGDDTCLLENIVKAQLSNAPEHRMSGNKLLEILKTRKQSLNLPTSAATRNLEPLQSTTPVHIMSSCESPKVVAVDKETNKESLNLLAFEATRNLEPLQSTTPVHIMSSYESPKLVDKGARNQSLYLLQFNGNALIKLQGSRSDFGELPQMPEPKRACFSVTACGSKMYVIGGYETKVQIASSLVQQYDMQKGWQDWSPMLEMRNRCGAAALGGRLFALGGEDGKTGLSSAEECDLETGRWARVAPMAAARYGVGVAAMGNLLFAVGGFGVDSAEWYDPRTGRWTETAPMHKPWDCCGCAALEKRLYVAGGYDAGNVIAAVEWFDLRAGRWTRVRDMGAPRSHFSLAALNGQLVAAGGYTSEYKRLDTVEVYDEKRDAWSTLDVRLPNDWGPCAGCMVED